MVFVSFICVNIKLSYARLAQWQSNGFVNRRLSVQVTCWAPFGGIVYRLGQLVFNQQSRVQLSVPLPYGELVQLVERLICIQKVKSSTLLFSTIMGR